MFEVIARAKRSDVIAIGPAHYKIILLLKDQNNVNDCKPSCDDYTFPLEVHSPEQGQQIICLAICLLHFIDS